MSEALHVKYRDSETLKFAAEINDFVRSKTDDPTVASVALQASQTTISFLPWPAPQPPPESA
jgi:hypothetical protein